MANENINNLQEIDEIKDEDLMGLAGGAVGQYGTGRWEILGTYTINAGENLQSVCVYYNYRVTVEELRKYNHLEGKSLKPGMQITVAKWIPNK